MGCNEFLTGEDICKVFEAATKKRSWDQFTKAQRKNITLWHNAIKSVGITDISLSLQNVLPLVLVSLKWVQIHDKSFVFISSFLCQQ